MRSNILVLTVVSAGLATTAIAQDINGGASFGGWKFEGNSLSDGIWVRNSVTNSFNIYSTKFTFNAQSVTGPVVGSSGFGAGWQAGDNVIGIGVGNYSDSANAAKTLFDSGGGGAIFKFDNRYKAASSLGAGDGIGGGIGYDLGVQINGGGTPAQTPSFVGGFGQTGVGFNSNTFTTYDGINPDSPFVSFFTTDGKNLQFLANLSFLERGGWGSNQGAANPFDLAGTTFDGGDYKVVIGFGGTEALIPTPASAAILGFAGLAAARRRR
jgi:hypothetical protein